MQVLSHCPHCGYVLNVKSGDSGLIFRLFDRLFGDVLGKPNLVQCSNSVCLKVLNIYGIEWVDFDETAKTKYLVTAALASALNALMGGYLGLLAILGLCAAFGKKDTHWMYYGAVVGVLMCLAFTVKSRMQSVANSKKRKPLPDVISMSE